jgi:hypothetical protein
MSDFVRSEVVNQSEEAHKLAEDMELLVAEHGGDADIAAAERAESAFLAGDDVAGERWIEIFRQIAKSHLLRARYALGTKFPL